MALLLGVAVFCGNSATAAKGGASGLIVFTSTRDGPPGVFAMRPDGTELRRLRVPGADPRIAPDGTRLLFNATGADGLGLSIRLLDLRTGTERRLPESMGLGWATTNASPWSPDGSRFALASTNDGLWIYNADGSGARRLTSASDADPAWSPDGTQVAFDRDDGLYVVDVDGTNLRRLARGSAEGPVWSPDGSAIAYAGANLAIFAVAPTGGTPRRIGVGTPAWSPDGRTLALADEDGAGLVLYGRGGARERVLVRTKPVDSPTWSPDGKSILATVDGDLWLFARDGATSRPLTQGARFGYVNSDATWSRSAPAKPAGTIVTPNTTFAGPLVAISRATGRVLGSWPRVSARGNLTQSLASSVSAIVDDGSGGWFVGGDFRAIGDVACPALAHLRADGSVDRSFCPRPNGAVDALVRLGRTLYLGGRSISRVAGGVRLGLAAVDTRTGRLRPWKPAVRLLSYGFAREGEIDAMAADPRGSTLYFFGSFDTVDGVRRLNMAAVDASTGQVTAFAPNPNTNAHGDGVSAMAVTATRVYAWGYFDQIGGRAVRFSTNAVDARTGKYVSAKPMMNGGPYSVVVDGNRVFAGGVIGRVSGKRRDDLISFDGATGTLDGWAPTTGSQVVEYVAVAGAAVVVALTRDHWSSGPRSVAAYDAASGRRTWAAKVRLDGGEVSAAAAAGNVVLVGGTFSRTQ